MFLNPCASCCCSVVGFVSWGVVGAGWLGGDGWPGPANNRSNWPKKTMPSVPMANDSIHDFYKRLLKRNRNISAQVQKEQSYQHYVLFPRRTYNALRTARPTRNSIGLCIIYYVCICVYIYVQRLCLL